MKHFFLIFFSTIVLGTKSYSSQRLDLPVDVDNSSTQNLEVPQEAQAPNTDYQFDIAAPTPPTRKTPSLIKENIFTSNESFGLKIGAAKSPDRSSSSLALFYTNHKTRLPLEYSLFFYKGETSLFSISMRRYTPWLNSWSSFYKVGIAVGLVPNQGLASPFNVVNYHSHVQVGLERYITSNKRIVLDCDWLLGKENALLQISVGNIWSW